VHATHVVVPVPGSTKNMVVLHADAAAKAHGVVFVHRSTVVVL
jgi:hypothetical protein